MQVDLDEMNRIFPDLSLNDVFQMRKSGSVNVDVNRRRELNFLKQV